MNKNKIIYQIDLPVGTFVTYSQRPTFTVSETSQVHGNKVVIPTCSSTQADGLYGANNNITPLAIKTADCLPIVILGENGHAHIHAGWRGIQLKIHLHENIKKLKPFFFYIGPHISAKCFEVTEEFKEHFPNDLNFFYNIDSKTFFSLSEKVKQDLNSQFPSAHVFTSTLCTYTNSRFHSFRRNQTAERNWNIYFPTDPIQL